MVLTDQLKRRVSNEVNEHFVDTWGKMKSLSESVQKLDDYEAVHGKNMNYKNQSHGKHNSYQATNSPQTRVENRTSDVQSSSKNFSNHVVPQRQEI